MNHSDEDVQLHSRRLRVAAAVIVDEGEVLACRRNFDKSAGGQWEFPGGKIEKGESPEHALVREIREELGAAIEVVKELTTNTTVVDGRAIELICLVCHLLESRPTKSTDHDQLQWLQPTNLVHLNWAAPDLPAVRILTAGERLLHA